MAIQITPHNKRTTDKALWVTILFYLSLVLFLVSVGSYFVFDHFIASYSKNLDDIKMEIRQAGTIEEKIKEKEVLETQGQIKDFSKLLANHRFISSFFTNFEEWCHNRVWFSNINLSINDFTVDLSGETDNFQTLGQQMIVLKNHELVEGVSLSNIQMNLDGRIDFNLSISFYPKVFSYNFETAE